MNYLKDYCNSIALFLFLFSLFSIETTFAQNKPRWFFVAGAGATGLRDFNSTFSDLQYSINEANASLDYRLNSKPSFLINAGAGLTGAFGGNKLLGWEFGMNIRSGGFQLTPEVLEQTGELSDFYKQMLPEFGKTNKFRYWAMHVPVSLTYLPFEYVGFKVGADLYYQFSSNITNKQMPYGELGGAMGFTALHAPKYRHPFQLGVHIGVFAPISDRLRIDLDFFTDIAPRLQVSPANPVISKNNFREMGAKLNTRYYLK